MARKREEKSNKNEKKSQKQNAASNLPHQNKNYDSLQQQLLDMKLTLREIPGDGNCLFGALADQLDGTPKSHQKHRQDVVAYMRSHRDDFEPFVEDDEPFEKHLSNLAELGNYGGNECIVAFARHNRVKVVIHQLNSALWQIDYSDGDGPAREVHISYHNGDHYNSVRRIGDGSSNPVNIRLSVKPTSEGEIGFKKAVPDNTFDNDCDSNSLLWTEDDYDGLNLQRDLTPPEDQHRLRVIGDRTGCRDAKLIQQYLVANCYDINDTIDDLLNFIIHQHRGEEPVTVMNGTTLESDQRDRRPSISGSQVDHQKVLADLQSKLKNTSLSSAKRKELKKQIRKYQSSERKRGLAQLQRDDNDSKRSSCWSSMNGEHMETIVVEDIGCLSI